MYVTNDTCFGSWYVFSCGNIQKTRISKTKVRFGTLNFFSFLLLSNSNYTFLSKLYVNLTATVFLFSFLCTATFLLKNREIHMIQLNIYPIKNFYLTKSRSKLHLFWPTPKK